MVVILRLQARYCEPWPCHYRAGAINSRPSIVGKTSCQLCAQEFVYALPSAFQLVALRRWL